MGRTLTFLLLCFIILACKRIDSKYPYAIKDFSKKLRPHLESIVTQGYVGYGPAEDFIAEKTSDDELNKLCYSEHPVLRAVAIEIVLERKKGNHYDFIISHLGDTATIAVDEGEWGINFKRVADYMISEAKWKSFADREMVIDEIIFRHNDLNSAYNILTKIGPEEKYYKYIREMAIRDKWNYENEHALYALSKFKKRADIDLLKKEFRNRVYMLQESSFYAMKGFQDTAFLNILDEWGKKMFVKSFCNRERYDGDTKEFINALAVYKNEKVADIFSRLLKWNPKFYCRGDLDYLKDNIYNAIWNNQCEAYSRFMKDVTVFIKDQEKRSLKLDLPVREKNPEEPTIHWWDDDDR